MVMLTEGECEAIAELIDALTGGNPENALSDNDAIDDPRASGVAKVFLGAGKDHLVPDHLRNVYWQK